MSLTRCSLQSLPDWFKNSLELKGKGEGLLSRLRKVQIRVSKSNADSEAVKFTVGPNDLPLPSPLLPSPPLFFPPLLSPPLFSPPSSS